MHEKRALCALGANLMGGGCACLMLSDQNRGFGRQAPYSGRGIGSKRHPVMKGDRAADNHQKVTVGLPERVKECQA
ncbi:hypothetical protein AD935_03085 [Gluconobacter japonicus]|nr:hypothetical protein AD935_03085 [Gluconobacter japonicus]